MGSREYYGSIARYIRTYQCFVPWLWRTRGTWECLEVAWWALLSLCYLSSPFDLPEMEFVNTLGNRSIILDQFITIGVLSFRLLRKLKGRHGLLLDRQARKSGALCNSPQSVLFTTSAIFVGSSNACGYHERLLLSLTETSRLDKRLQND